MPRRVLIALAFFLALAVILTWPAALRIGTGVPADLGDPLLNTWILWWNAQAVPLTAAWWDAPAFYPASGVLAFSEHLLGFAWFTSPLLWLGLSPLAVYSLAFIGSYAAAGLGGWWLGRVLTGRDDAALLAGIAFAAAPYRAAQTSHLQVLMACWMPIALVGLHRFVETRRARWAVLFATAWLVQGLTNGYYLVFFGLVVAAWLAYFACRAGCWRQALTIVAASALVALAMLPFLVEYRMVHERFGFSRMPGEVAAFSADALSLFDASPRLLLWGRMQVFHKLEGELCPGLVLVGLVAAGVACRRSARARPALAVARVAFVAVVVIAVALLVWYVVFGRWRVEWLGIGASMLSPRRPLIVAIAGIAALAATWPGLAAAWRRRSPLLFYTGAAGVLFVLALGPVPAFGGAPLGWIGPYALLQHLPGFAGLRVPARLWMPVLVCLSAALSLAWARLPVPASARGLAATAAGLALILEGMTAGVPVLHPPSPWPSIVRPENAIPLLQIPSTRADPDVSTMYRAMPTRRRVVAGYSGYFPPSWSVMRVALAEGDPSLVESLAALGPADVLLDTSSDRRGSWARRLAAQPLREPLRSEGRWTLYPLAARPRARRPAALGVRIVPAAVAASVHDMTMAQALDGRMDTAWSAPQQVTGDTITIDLGQPRAVGAVRTWHGRNVLDYSRGLAVERSDDGATWVPAWQGSTAGLAWQAANDDPTGVPVTFGLDGCATRYLRLRQTVAHIRPWTIWELEIFGPGPETPACGSDRSR